MKYDVSMTSAAPLLPVSSGGTAIERFRPKSSARVGENEAERRVGQFGGGAAHYWPPEHGRR
jgi:hypothetical protein